MPPITFQADIKDASLAPLRQRLVSLGRTLREDGSNAAKNVSKSLAFLRRAASLPLGLTEARQIADVLYDADDEVDASVRAMFRPKMALSTLLEAGDTAPAHSTEIKALAEAISNKAAEWEAETPVSSRLSILLNQAEWNTATTILAFPDRRIAETYLASDRAVQCACTVIDHRGIFEFAAIADVKRIIVVGPTTQAVRALLTTSAGSRCRPLPGRRRRQRAAVRRTHSVEPSGRLLVDRRKSGRTHRSVAPRRVERSARRRRG